MYIYTVYIRIYIYMNCFCYYGFLLHNLTFSALFDRFFFKIDDLKKIHPGRLTWNLRIHPWKRRIIFQTIIFRFYVNLRVCMTSGKKRGQSVPNKQFDSSSRFPLDPPLSDAGLEQAQFDPTSGDWCGHGGCMVGTWASRLLACKLLDFPTSVVWLLVVLYHWIPDFFKHQHIRTFCSVLEWLRFVLVSSRWYILYDMYR